MGSGDTAVGVYGTLVNIIQESTKQLQNNILKINSLTPSQLVAHNLWGIKSNVLITPHKQPRIKPIYRLIHTCLLYTSDAADER